MEKTNIKITGMHCASCSTLVEKALNKQKGVKLANVNLTTEKATIGFDPKLTNSKKLIKVIEGKGYGAEVISGNDKKSSSKKDELSKLRTKLIISSIFAIPHLF